MNVELVYIKDIYDYAKKMIRSVVSFDNDKVYNLA